MGMIDGNLPPLPTPKDATNWRFAMNREAPVTVTAKDIDDIISIFSTTHHAMLEMYAALTGAGGADKRQEYAKNAFGTLHEANSLVTHLLNSFIERADNGDFDEA
ncbi:hypothetical protein H9643_19005 [Ochrobactrum sp. Sa2BUA5]|nr:hypothetical protein [Ochrobactrum gallinarum]